MKKKYFHLAPQAEIDLMIETGVTIGEVIERYKQPKWCFMPGALEGKFGCWSLMDSRIGGLRTKISPGYCADCDYCKR